MFWQCYSAHFQISICLSSVKFTSGKKKSIISYSPDDPFVTLEGNSCLLGYIRGWVVCTCRISKLPSAIWVSLAPPMQAIIHALRKDQYTGGTVKLRNDSGSNQCLSLSSPAGPWWASLAAVGKGSAEVFPQRLSLRFSFRPFFHPYLSLWLPWLPLWLSKAQSSAHISALRKQVLVAAVLGTWSFLCILSYMIHSIEFVDKKRACWDRGKDNPVYAALHYCTSESSDESCTCK